MVMGSSRASSVRSGSPMMMHLVGMMRLRGQSRDHPARRLIGDHHARMNRAEVHRAIPIEHAVGPGVVARVPDRRSTAALSHAGHPPLPFVNAVPHGGECTPDGPRLASQKSVAAFKSSVRSFMVEAGLPSGVVA